MKKSQQDLLDHSAKKVELLSHYLTRYLAVLGNDFFTEVIHCHDLFCGEGVYPNGGEGSPIAFAKHLRTIASRCAGKRFTFHFNDKDPEKVANVRKAIENTGPGPANLEITSSVLLFEQVVAGTVQKLAAMKREKAFLFIDPYGYKETSPSLIQTLMEGGKCELLLFLPIQHMYRFTHKGTPDALDQFLDAFRRHKPLPEGASTLAFIDYLKDGFRALLPQCMVDSFVITKDASTAFCLFFFTTSLKGAEKMLEAKWKLDEFHGVGWSYQAGWSEDMLFQTAHVNPLEALLKAQLATGPHTNAAIYESTLRAGFLPTHAKQVLSEWQKAGRIKVCPASVKKGSFYLNYAATNGAKLAERKSITIQLT